MKTGNEVREKSDRAVIQQAHGEYTKTIKTDGQRVT